MSLRHRHRDDDKIRFRMQTRLLSVGDDSWIEDGHGDRAYLVDGKALRLRDTWVLKDVHHHEVAVIKERAISIRDAITVESGDVKATVKKALVGIRDRYVIEVHDGHDMKAHGNIVDHEYEIEGEHGTVATISKRWFRVRDTYGVEVADDVDPALVLALTVAIDALASHRS